LSWPKGYFDSLSSPTANFNPSSWFNPWPIKYLLPAVKWFPLYWPNETWEVVPFKGPPDGAIGPWWKMLPKNMWPIDAPWEPKIFGAWPASNVTMSEDLPPSIWPGGHRAPPFGFISIKMPGTPDVSGDQTPKGNQIPFVHMNMHMRPDFGPIHHMRIMTRDTPMGQKFYLIDRNWDYAEYRFKEYRAALKRMKMEKYMALLAKEIATYDGKPKPHVDLF
jgi:hypothetical protein